MITVSSTVSQLLNQDEIASESLREGFLNLSAYADKIQHRIEELTFKPVKRGTIIVALARMQKDKAKLSPLIPQIEIKNLSVKSDLCIFTYEKTLDIQRKIAVLHPFLLPMNDLFSVTEGPSEVTIIFAGNSEKLIQKHFNIKPKLEYQDLVAISVQFSQKFAATPNFLFGLFSGLAAKRINIIEVVSTFTQLSFLVKKEDLEETVRILNSYTIRNKQIHEK